MKSLLEEKNYRMWKRAMEIELSTKHKLAFVLSTLARPDDDPVKATQWNASNNLAYLITFFPPFVEVAFATNAKGRNTTGGAGLWKNAQLEVSALYSKGSEEQCGVSSNKGHTREKCRQLAADDTGQAHAWQTGQVCCPAGYLADLMEQHPCDFSVNSYADVIQSHPHMFLPHASTNQPTTDKPSGQIAQPSSMISVRVKRKPTWEEDLAVFLHKTMQYSKW
ncbi:hypothetical protein Cgig2_005970 [Carnegiea gigantea]|uniref:Retrotransposon Copia-like N-terminal domain-containing protein n=1 Tax=Carnegiea gigantea TaxID=171969 RepID=A0A9Q1QJ15_9CARY|nr:hypothetical protein Cgig2_005970 [Carnegiea gigantea]